MTDARHRRLMGGALAVGVVVMATAGVYAAATAETEAAVSAFVAALGFGGVAWHDLRGGGKPHSQDEHQSKDAL